MHTLDTRMYFIEHLERRLGLSPAALGIQPVVIVAPPIAPAVALDDPLPEPQPSPGPYPGDDPPIDHPEIPPSGPVGPGLVLLGGTNVS
jgi:hypothetical protein